MGLLNDEGLEDLRALAVQALEDDPAPPAVLQYVEALEQAVLTRNFRSAQELSRTVWRQFHSGSARVVESQEFARGAVMDDCVRWRPDGQTTYLTLMEISLEDGARLRRESNVRGVPSHFWRVADGIGIWPAASMSGTLVGLRPLGAAQ